MTTPTVREQDVAVFAI